MQRLIRIVFLSIALIYLGGMIYQVGYFAYFKVNQDEIIEKFCVNKDNPEMHCNGQCHLNKELKSVQLFDEDDEQQNKRRSLPQIELEFIIAVFPYEQARNFAGSDHFVELIWHTNTALCSTEPDSFWHPPQVC